MLLTIDPSLGVGIALLLVASCTHPEPRPAPLPASSAVAESSTAAVTNPTPPALASASAAPAAPSALPERETPLPIVELGFHVLLEGKVWLAPLDNTMFVHDNWHLGRLEGRDLIQSPELARGRMGCELPVELVTTVAGRWPKWTFLAAYDQLGNFPGAVIEQWDGKEWRRRHENLEQFSRYTNLVPWGSTGVLGAIIAQGYGKELSLRATTQGWSHEPFDPAPGADPITCGTRIVPSRVAAAGSHYFVLGSTCAEEGRRVVVEQFVRGRRKGRLFELPEREGRAVELWSDDEGHGNWIHARSATEVYVGAAQVDTATQATSPYLARFDGSNWSEQETPILGAITSIDSTDDGALWVTAGGRLWRRDAARQWVEIGVPGNATTHRVVAWAPDDVWLETEDAVFRSQAPNRVLSWHDGCFYPVEVAPAARDDGCSPYFVVLEAAPVDAPANYDYPRTHALITETTPTWRYALVIETEIDGRRFVGVRVNEYAQGVALRQVARDRLPGADGRFVCGAPREIRQLFDDLTSY